MYVLVTIPALVSGNTNVDPVTGVASNGTSVPPSVAPHMAQPRMGVGGASPIMDGSVSAVESVNLLNSSHPLEYRNSLIRAARCLLGSVTRVLLLADTIVVKQLLLSKEKVHRLD